MMYVFIVNPKSGHSKTINASIAIDNYCKEMNVDYKIHYTSGPLDATTIANTYSKKDTIIYSVGGDGTLNEVVNGMVNSNSSLVVVPAGTGNDFYKSLKNGLGGKIDVGKVNNKYFINIASIGLDAEVADLANDLKETKIPNGLVYYLSLIKTFINYNNIELTDNNIPITLLAICNGSYYGGGFNIAPNAIIDDGKFDIYRANNLNKIEMLNMLLKLLKGRHGELPSVDVFTDDKIIIDSNVPLTCNVDGEIIKENHFEFKLLEKSLNINNDELGIIKLLKIKKIIK